VTAGGPSTNASRRATSTIPIVMAQVGDADGIGLINSLAAPGGNVTGVTDLSADLSAKRLELLKETVPKAKRIAVLYNADDMGMVMRFHSVERAAKTLQVAVQSLGVRQPHDFEVAFTTMARERPDAMFLVTDALTLNRKRVIEFASAHRIPAMYEFSFLVQDGGLMSYGASQDDNYRRAAAYVDRLFKGATASASTLPVERPSRYYLAINQKTARTLGFTFPPSILVRADQVIE
jgi:putative ABC transport system substrate-binding protein